VSVLFVIIAPAVIFSQPPQNATEVAKYQADLLELEAHNARRILGGNSVSSAEWRLTRPWLVENVCDYSDGNGWVPCGCSSTIIDHHYLITAGHCLNCPYTSYKVALRFSDGFVDDQVFQEIHNPDSIIGSFDSKLACGLRNPSYLDLGLQYLSKPIKFRYGVQPFHGLLDNTDFDCKNQFGYVAGWGVITEAGANPFAPEYSPQLYKLREQVYDSSICQAKINEWTPVVEVINGLPAGYCTYTFNDHLLCTSAKDLNDVNPLNPVIADPKGICFGDSGSPLYDPIRRRILGFVADNLSTGIDAPCGIGLDIFTRFDATAISWVRRELKVRRSPNWTCPTKAASS